MSILVQYIDDPSNLTVLLGADLIRQLIEVECTFDDELVDYYISMLKTLVMRLSKMPYLINLFYNSALKIYPLFIQAQQFANHKDQLVRTSVRTISLTLLSVDDQQDHLFAHMPQAHFFIQIAIQLRDQWLKVETALKKVDQNETGVARLIEDSNEFLFYIQDLYDVLTYKPYADMLTSALLKIVYAPMVLQSLCVMTMKPKLSI